MPTVVLRSAFPLDLAACTARYGRWGADPVNVVSDGGYRRAIHAPDGRLGYRATQQADGIAIEVADAGHASSALADLTYRIGESLPHEAMADLAMADSRLGAAYRRRPGYRPPLTPDMFEMLVTSVTAQQVNLTWATTTRARLVHTFGEQLDDLWLFPTPEALARAEPSELRALQFTWSKSEYVVGIARAGAEGAFENLADLEDEAVIEQLTKMKGVGRWTADWALARGLGRPTAVAAGDLGVQKAVGLLYLELDRKATEDEVRRAAAQWGNAANWAAHLLLEELS